MFNSRDPECRFPLGAVTQGTRIHFRITLPRNLGCSSARLVIEHDGAGMTHENMFWCGLKGDEMEFWECHFTPNTRGLYFYHFEADTGNGIRRLGKTAGGEAVLDGDERWQLTVYEDAEETPDWLLGGVMYQIFPDRFFSSRSEKRDLPSGRTYHESWDEQPEWRPNAEGKITNSDFFGGDLRGITEKLGYLKSLGVTCIYLNPIFESHSNHRYDTANYEKIDPLLGDEEDFRELCEAAGKLDIRVVLDGVFSHTGSDSIYFNKEGRYPDKGAFQSKKSPYYKWYSFKRWPNSYECWWNFNTLPNVKETEPGYLEYITGKDGIVRKWLRLGASGWRLDVADELPDDFIDALHIAAKEEKGSALVLGEVWEDASNKSSYGERRRYLLGGQLDSVMNYPFRDAILNFLLGGGAENFAETVESIVENYPPCALNILMNHIGTHDTERALTVLGGKPADGRGREWQSAQKLSPQERALAVKRLKLASLMQYILPGVPCIYYGDEAGMEGYRDPFNRGTYPWGHEDEELLSWYRGLGEMRIAQRDILSTGKYKTLLARGDLLAFGRENDEDSRLIGVFNRGDLPADLHELSGELISGQPVLGNVCDDGKLAPLDFLLVRKEKTLDN